jgi:hypothetical protein
MTPESSAAGFDSLSALGIDAITASTTGHANWLEGVLRQLEAIRELPKGWDSHGGDAVRGDIVAAAQTLARSLARYPQVPRPLVCPTSAGGVQFEWEADGAYLEIHFEGPTEAECYFESQSPPTEKEFTFHDGDDLGGLIKYISSVRGSSD